MVTCNNCKSLNNDGNTVCEFCGASLLNTNPNTQPQAQNVNPGFVPNNPINNNENNNLNGFGQSINTQPQPQNVNPGFVPNNPINNNENNNLNGFEQNINSQPQPSMTAPTDQPNMDTQNSNQIQYDVDDLVNCYIGKNAEKLTKGGFSWSSLLFGPFYAWYRKMYKIFGIWLGIAFAIWLIFGLLKLPIVLMILQFILTIVMAILFKGMYKKHVNEEVDKIKIQNYGKPQEELNEICRKKGGTAIAAIIIYILLAVGTVIYLIIALIATIAVMSFLGEAQKEMYASNGLYAINTVRNEYLLNEPESEGNCSNNVCVYNKDQINNMLEKKFNAEVKSACAWITKQDENTYKYEICMVDSNGVGFNRTDSESLNKNDIKSSGVTCVCE